MDCGHATLYWRVPSESYFAMGMVEQIREWAALFGLARGENCAKVSLMRSYVACVGLIVLIGCFTLVVVPEQPPASRQLLLGIARPTVVIDAGHGGNDEGAKCKGVYEKDLTLNLAFRLDRILRERGFPTVLTRTTDRYVPLADRVAVANNLDSPAIFVSIHFNQGSEKYVTGIETFYAAFKAPHPKDWTWVGFFDRSSEEPTDLGQSLAADVQSAATENTGARNRGFRSRDLYVTRNTRVPAILVEGGFITNPNEAHLLCTDDYANELAQGIANGIVKWYDSQPGTHRPPAQLANAAR